jgi:hypothetical protein
MKLRTYIYATLNARLHDASAARAKRLTDWINGQHSGTWDPIRFAECERCSSYVSSDDTYIIEVGHHDTQQWCEGCRDSHSFCCDDCNNDFADFVSSGSNTAGDTVCSSCAESYFCCEGCDETYHNDDYCEDGRCSNCCSNDDDEDRDEFSVPGYHSQSRNFRGVRNEQLFGIELEIKVKDIHNVKAMYDTIVRHGFIGERDGSLDGRLGIEIVGDPMTFDRNKDKWIPLLNDLRGKCVGWNAGDGYGMHISLNRGAFTTLHQGKVMCFIHQNKSLCEVVAGRSENSWARYHPKNIKDAYNDCDEKYQAISLRSSRRMEVRIFRSTLLPSGFLRNLEFVASIVEFTKEANYTTELFETPFRKWLDRPSNRKAYPNLHAHLFRREHEIRQHRRLIYGASQVTTQPNPCV